MHFLQFNSTPNESDDERAQTIDRASTQHDNVENERHDLNLSGGDADSFVDETIAADASSRLLAVIDETTEEAAGVLGGHVGDQAELLAGNVDEGEVQVDQHQEVFLF